MSDPLDNPSHQDHPTGNVLNRIEVATLKASTIQFLRTAWSYRLLILCIIWTFTYNSLLKERWRHNTTQDWLRICHDSRGRAKQAEEWQAWSKEREHYHQLQKEHEQLKKRWETLEYVIVGMRREKDQEEADNKMKKSEEEYWLERSTWSGPWDHGGPEPL
ncbi:hypothetical protein BKA70DRAFT_1266720 [Coprinopsis sp. MPI-PUGE-AT-0042]|nr:hypothetical protein BKA70DRAFT_1266720 [Coprinopsis sp. MPI-PUGE-AT-0042]